MRHSSNQTQAPVAHTRSLSDESFETIEPAANPQSNLTTRLLGLAVSATFSRQISPASNNTEELMARHMAEASPQSGAMSSLPEIPRQTTRAISQLRRQNAVNRSTHPHTPNQIALYAESLLNGRQTRAVNYTSASVHPSFRSKAVCSLLCKFCDQTICGRGMKAILLADTRVYYGVR